MTARKYGLALLLLMLATLTPAPVVIAAATDDDAAAANSALQEIVKELNALDQWFNIADRKRIALQKALRAQDRKVAETGKAMRSASANIAKARGELAELAARKARLQDQRDQQAASIAGHISAAWRLNGRDLVRQVLNQEDTAELDRMLKYHQYFANARVDAVNDFADTVAQLDANAVELTRQAQRLQDQQAALSRSEKTLRAERGAQRELIASLKAETVSRTEQRKRLLTDRARLESLLAELAKRSTAQDGSGFVANKGKLPMPLQARISKAYGSKRNDGELTWNGVLFSAATGTSVQAVYQGKVVFANWLRGYGLLLIVDHGGSYMTLYGHADSLYKNVGDWVESGEPVASAGLSGGAQNAGLYFEVRHKGKTLDPINWLQR